MNETYYYFHDEFDGAEYLFKNQKELSIFLNKWKALCKQYSGNLPEEEEDYRIVKFSPMTGEKTYKDYCKKYN
jgi:hypothetical protein